MSEHGDNNLTVRDPYQTATISVQDAVNNTVLAQQIVVAPLSTETHCDNCHSDTGDATVIGGITPTGKVETNILSLHDKLSMSKYPAGHARPLRNPASRPILCAECHASQNKDLKKRASKFEKNLVLQ